MLRVALAVAFLVSAAAMAHGGDSCCVGCAQCGCSQCKKVCRLVCETKTETIICYDCKCEDFCLPGPSCLLGTKCVPNVCDPCNSHREFCWQPSCGRVRQRVVLVKVPKTIEKPAYRCVVECVCCQCGQARIDADATKKLVETGNLEGLEVAPADAPQIEKVVQTQATGGDTDPQPSAKPVKLAGFWQRVFGK